LKLHLSSHYQKQSLAFMMDVENNYDTSSGWILSIIGMGKSAIVIAAICANPIPVDDQPNSEQVMRHNSTRTAKNSISSSQSSLLQSHCWDSGKMGKTELL
jgi:hypothetical protein